MQPTPLGQKIVSSLLLKLAVDCPFTVTGVLSHYLVSGRYVRIQFPIYYMSIVPLNKIYSFLCR